MSFVIDGDEEAARPPVDEAKLLAREADGWRVHDWEELLYILGEQTEEETLVSVLWARKRFISRLG